WPSASWRTRGSRCDHYSNLQGSLAVTQSIGWHHGQAGVSSSRACPISIGCLRRTATCRKASTDRRTEATTMTITPRSSKAQKEEEANPGFSPPPLIYLTSIVVGLAFQWMWPRPVLSGVGPGLLGGVLVVVALLVFAASVQRFRTAGTPVPARKPTTAIVRTGPYRFSRNPIYLAFSLFQLGIAIWSNSLWLLVTLVGAVGLMHFVVIPREEQYL